MHDPLTVAFEIRRPWPEHSSLPAAGDKAARWRIRLHHDCGTWCADDPAHRDGAFPWWQGERGLFHSDCSSIKSAHAVCTCDVPVLDGGDHGRCAVCDRFRPFGYTEANLARARDLQTIPHGGRRAAETVQVAP